MTSRNTYTATGQLFTQLILETFRLNGRLLVVGDKLTKDHGLTSARWQVLGAVSASDVPLTVPSVARNMGLQRQSVQRIVDVLEADGLLELSDNPHHKTARLVKLTAAGQSAFDRITEVQMPWVNKLSAGMAQDDIERALTVLREVRARLDDA